jgi:Leucine-rich repeat (LRR) protein
LVDSMHDGNSDDGLGSDAAKRRQINILLDQCESARFTFKKRLALNNLSLTASDIPLKDLCGTPLGNSLHKLSLTGNRLGTIPARLVQSLPYLKHMDLSQCELHHLPDKWSLPQLKKLNLSHNKLSDFPEEVRC